MKWLWKVLIVLVATVTTVGVVSQEASGRGGGGRGGGGGGKGGGGRGGGGRGGGKGGRGGGGRSSGMEDRKDVVKDMEERRLQSEKEDRIIEARAAGAEAALDEMQQGILDRERSQAAKERRVDWRSRANPG
jgi:hypothetical protein